MFEALSLPSMVGITFESALCTAVHHSAVHYSAKNWFQMGQQHNTLVLTSQAAFCCSVPIICSAALCLDFPPLCFTPCFAAGSTCSAGGGASLIPAYFGALYLRQKDGQACGTHHMSYLSSLLLWCAKSTALATCSHNSSTRLSFFVNLIERS